MHARYQVWLLACCVGAVGCGGSESEPPPAATGGAAPRAASDVIPAGALAKCAGFTPSKAASLLGVAPETITDYSRPEGRLRMCHYRHADDAAKTVSFTLSHRESVDQAKASIGKERESMGAARGAIDRATGTQSKTAASEDVSGIGDDAFYSAMNDAIMMRVGNVIAQVAGPADMTLKKRVAEEVARGLRQ
jgi:hypothetical protein